MGDLLIRDMPESMRRELSALAQHHGHSLSEEAKRLLQKGLLALVQEEQASDAADTYADFRQEFTDALLADDEYQEMMTAIDGWKQESTQTKAEAAE